MRESVFSFMRSEMRKAKIQIEDAENPWIVLFQHITLEVHKKKFDEFREVNLFPTLVAMAERDESQHTAWYWLSTSIAGQKIFSDLLKFFSATNQEFTISQADLSEAWDKLASTDDGIKLFYRLMDNYEIFPLPTDLSKTWGLLDLRMAQEDSVAAHNVVIHLLNKNIFPKPGTQFNHFWLMQSISTSLFAKLIQRNILPHDELTWRACYFSFKRKTVSWAMLRRSHSLVELFGDHVNVANGFSVPTLICDQLSCHCRDLHHRNEEHLELIRKLMYQKAREYQLLSTMVSCWSLFHRRLTDLAEKYISEERGGRLGKRRVANLLTELGKLTSPFVQVSQVQKLVQLYCAILYSTSDELKGSFLGCLEGLRKYTNSNFESDDTFLKRLLKKFQNEQGITEQSCLELLKALEAETKPQSQTTASFPYAGRRQLPEREESGVEMHLP